MRNIGPVVYLNSTASRPFNLKERGASAGSAPARHELELRIDGLRGENHAVAASGLKQMYGAMLGQLAVLIGVAYSFVSHMVPTPR